ncbi:MAG: hypothetical protein QM761_14385 [Pseudoxanthomonas sp.]
MNAKPVYASLILFAVQGFGCAPAALAGEAQSLPQVQAVQYVFDCAAPRVLPSQREVGEWTGQHNFAQVYQTRQKLMAEVARACNKSGVARVQLVRQAPAREADPAEAIARSKSAAR